jgi:hypothetical protein
MTVMTGTLNNSSKDFHVRRGQGSLLTVYTWSISGGPGPDRRQKNITTDPVPPVAPIPSRHPH